MGDHNMIQSPKATPFAEAGDSPQRSNKKGTGSVQTTVESPDGAAPGSSTKSPVANSAQTPSIEERAAVAAIEDAAIQQALKRSLEEAGREFDETQQHGGSGSAFFPGSQEMETEGHDLQQSQGRSGEPQHGDEQWTCIQCTFINECSSAACDMCLSVRPRPKVCLPCHVCHFCLLLIVYWWLMFTFISFNSLQSSRVLSGMSQRSQAVTASQASFETPWSKPSKTRGGTSTGDSSNKSSSNKRQRHT